MSAPAITAQPEGKPPRAKWRRRFRAARLRPQPRLHHRLSLPLIVLLPLAGLAISAASLGWNEFWAIAFDPRVYRRPPGSPPAPPCWPAGQTRSSASASPGFWCDTASPARRWLDAAVDLPFALPTAVAGIALATLYAPNGPIGPILEVSSA